MSPCVLVSLCPSVSVNVHVCPCVLPCVDQSAGRYKESLARASRVLQRTEQLSDGELERRAELEAHLHSYIGNAQLELGQLDEALKHHQLDLNIAKQQCVFSLSLSTGINFLLVSIAGTL